jgi:hypothetical protein
MKKALIVVLAMAFVAAFTLPVMAAEKAEWGFYGSARVETFSYDDDKMSGLVPNGGVNGWDDRDTIWSFWNNSRFGATAKAGDISGRFEYRTSTETRVLFGEWDFGAGKLGIGKDYTPVNMFYSNQAAYGEINMLNTGGVYTGADGMIRLRFQGLADMIDIDFAFVEPAVLGANGAGEDTAQVVGNDMDTTLPQLEARVLFNWGALQMEFNGGWVEFEDTQIVGGAERSYDIDAWIVAFGLKYAMGPFSFKGNIHTGENVSSFGLLCVDACTPQYDAGTDSIVDRDQWGWHAVVGFKLNDMLSFEAGYGETEMEPNQAGLVDDDLSAYYLQAVIAPTAGVLIIPEIGERDYQNDINGNDEGETFYFGATWKISF